jgi:hypothetical protein
MKKEKKERKKERKLILFLHNEKITANEIQK